MQKQWLPSHNLHKKVRWCEMLEEMLLQLLIISLFGNVALAIISFILIIVITIFIYKENHISADEQRYDFKIKLYW